MHDRAARRRRDKTVIEEEWSVAGLTRAEARIVSYVDGRAAYGGTPSDASVVAAIRDLKSRGLSVLFYPFVMMDIPADNGLAKSVEWRVYAAAISWRGRITCDPAPGRAAASMEAPRRRAGCGVFRLVVSGRRRMVVPGRCIARRFALMRAASTLSSLARNWPP